MEKEYNFFYFSFFQSEQMDGSTLKWMLIV